MLIFNSHWTFAFNHLISLLLFHKYLVCITRNLYFELLPNDIGCTILMCVTLKIALSSILKHVWLQNFSGLRHRPPSFSHHTSLSSYYFHITRIRSHEYVGDIPLFCRHVSIIYAFGTFGHFYLIWLKRLCNIDCKGKTQKG